MPFLFTKIFLLYIIALSEVVMKKYFLLVSTILLSHIAYASSCVRYPINFVVKTDVGDVIYDTKHSRDEFAKIAKVKVSPHTVGLTVTSSPLPVVKGTLQTRQTGDSACAQLSFVEFTIKYDKITVFIDKKYPKYSCNFKVTKEHEDYHVSVFQQALLFFKPDIEDALRKAIREIKPEKVYNEKQAHNVLIRQQNHITKKLKPLLEHINKKITEKNYAIDTPESYKKTTKRCKKW